MQETFYFRKLGGWPFPMDVKINDDQHRINFIRSMERKKFIQVTEAEFQKIAGSGRSMHLCAIENINQYQKSKFQYYESQNERNLPHLGRIR